MSLKSRILLLLVGIFFSGALMAQELQHFSRAEQRQRFHYLTQQFRCLVCQNEDLASSNAGLAKDLRQQIYQLLITGKSNQEIVDYMVARYGDFILFRPPLQKQTLLLWLGPLFFLVLGVAFVFFVIRRAVKPVGDTHVDA